MSAILPQRDDTGGGESGSDQPGSDEAGSDEAGSDEAGSDEAWRHRESYLVSRDRGAGRKD